MKKEWKEPIVTSLGIEGTYGFSISPLDGNDKPHHKPGCPCANCRPSQS